MNPKEEGQRESAGLGAKRDSTVLEARLLQGGSREYAPRNSRVRSRRDSLDPTAFASFAQLSSDNDSTVSSDSVQGGGKGIVLANILLLVHEHSRSRLANLLGTNGHTLTIGSTPEEVLKAVENSSQSFDVFLLHLKCFRSNEGQTMRWETLLAKLWANYENLKVVLLAKEKFGEIPKAIRGIELGAAAFFCLPIEDDEFIKKVIYVANLEPGSIIAVDNGDADFLNEVREWSPGGPRFNITCVSSAKHAMAIIENTENLVCIIVSEPPGDESCPSEGSKILKFFEGKPSINSVPVISAMAAEDSRAEIQSGIYALKKPLNSPGALKCLRDVLAQRRLGTWVERSMVLGTMSTFAMPNSTPASRIKRSSSGLSIESGSGKLHRRTSDSNLVNQILQKRKKSRLPRKSILGSVQDVQTGSDSSIDSTLLTGSAIEKSGGDPLLGSPKESQGTHRSSAIAPKGTSMKRTGSMLSMARGIKSAFTGTFKKKKVAPTATQIFAADENRTTSDTLLAKDARKRKGSINLSEKHRRLSSTIHSVGNFGMAEGIFEDENKLPPYIVRHNSNLKRKWDFAIIFMVMWNLYFIPLHAAFFYENPDSVNAAMRLLDDIIDVLFIFDVILNFRSTFLDERGNEVIEPQKIRDHYLKTWFAIDAIAAFPFDIVASWFLGDTQTKLGALAILKCFRLLRLGKMLKYVEYFLNANAVRILKLIFGVFLLAHWTTCSWFLLNNLEEGNTWMYERGLYSSSVTELYIETLYSVFLMLFRNMDVHPVTTAENTFAIIVILLGAVMYATIFGSIAVVIANFDAGNASFHQKKLSILDRMRFLRLPTEIQNKVLRFYDCLWTLQRCTDGSQSNFISELSPSLAAEVLCTMHMGTLKKVPFFSEFSQVVVNEICFKLKAQVYLDGDFIVREGDFGDWMGFITRGKVKVSSSDGIDVVLHEEHYFGEMSLLFSTRRTASVIALVYCVITQLTADDFSDIRSKFPEHGKHMERVMESYFYGLSDGEPTPSPTLHARHLSQIGATPVDE